MQHSVIMVLTDKWKKCSDNVDIIRHTWTVLNWFTLKLYLAEKFMVFAIYFVFLLYTYIS